MRTAAQRAVDDAENAAMTATVRTLSPLRVVVAALDGGLERRPVDGFPAHPAGRGPLVGDGCLVTFDELDRLWITSWKATA